MGSPKNIINPRRREGTSDDGEEGKTEGTRQTDCNAMNNYHTMIDRVLAVQSTLIPDAT